MLPFALLNNRGRFGVLMPWILIGVIFAIGFFVGISAHAAIPWPTGEPSFITYSEVNRQTPDVFQFEDSLSQSQSKAFLALDSEPRHPPGIGNILGTSSILEAVNFAVVRVSTGSAAGSGVIIDPAGVVLTSSHVVVGSALVSVLIEGENPLIGDVFRVDEEAGLALVRIPSGVYHSAELGTEVDVALGAPVYAIGFPLNMAGPASITAGVVSRHFFDPESGRQIIQADAAINIENSGGTIVDGQGRVIGITTSILGDRPSAKTSGIGFAVSIVTIKDYFVD